MSTCCSGVPVGQRRRISFGWNQGWDTHSSLLDLDLTFMKNETKAGTPTAIGSHLLAGKPVAGHRASGDAWWFQCLYPADGFFKQVAHTWLGLIWQEVHTHVILQDSRHLQLSSPLSSKLFKWIYTHVPLTRRDSNPRSCSCSCHSMWETWTGCTGLSI